MGWKENLEIILTGDAKGLVKAMEESATASQEAAAAAQEQAAAATEAGNATAKAGAKIEASQAKVAASAEESGATTSSSMLGGAAAVGAAGLAVFELAKKWDEAALSAGKMSDATGLTAEEASRWSVVAKGADVDTAALEKSIGFMNKTAGNAPKKFTDLDVSLTDVNGRAKSTSQLFLSVVDRLNGIADPTAKAAAGAKLLGKGWQSMAELIGEGSASLTKSLDAVNKNQVFSDSDVQQAKEFRAEMKELTNTLQGLALQAGKTFVPMVGELAAILDPLAKATQATDKHSSSMEKAAHFAYEWLTPVGLIPKIGNAAKDAAEGLANQFRDNDGVTGVMIGTITKLDTSLEHVGLTHADVTDKANAVADATEHVGLINTTVAETAEHLAIMAAEQAKQNQALVSSEQGVVAALQATRQAEQDLIDTSRTGIDAGHDYEVAQHASAVAIKDLNKVLADKKSTMNDVYDAEETARSGVIATSVAYVASQHAALDSKQGIDLQIKSLYEQATKMAPGSALQLNILAYIKQLQGIPTSINTTVTTTYVDKGDISTHHDSANPNGTSTVTKTQIDPLTGLPIGGRFKAAKRTEDDLSNLLGSGVAGTWVAQATAATDTVNEALSDADQAALKLAKNQYDQGAITLQQYQVVVKQMYDKAVTEFGQYSDLATGFYDQLAQSSQTSTQSQIADITSLQQAELDLALTRAQAAEAQAELNDKFIQGNVDATQAQKDQAHNAVLDSVIAGAKATAADQGLTGDQSDAAVFASIQDWLRGHPQYADVGAAFLGGQNNTGVFTASAQGRLHPEDIAAMGAAFAAALQQNPPIMDVTGAMTRMNQLRGSVR